MKIKPSEIEQNFLRDVEKKVKPKEDWEKRFDKIALQMIMKGFSANYNYIDYNKIRFFIRQELARQREEILRSIKNI
jgi:hypothetical protein